MDFVFSESILTRDHTPAGAVPLGHEAAASYLAVLVRLAALEGFEPDEGELLRRIATCLGFSEDLADLAARVLEGDPVPVEALVDGIADPGLRLCLLRDAYRVAAADGRISDEEKRELVHVARALGIANHTASVVRSIAMQEAMLHREFAGMVRAARRS